MSTRDYTPELTPVEEHGGVLVKREDAWSLGGAAGAKARAIISVAAGRDGLISAGGRISPQLERAALAARALGMPARLHTAAGAMTPELRCARAAGATLLRHHPGRLTVIKARMRADAAERPGWAAVPYGMDHPEYLRQVAEQTANLPAGPYRLVVPCGSGMTLAGILAGAVPPGVEVLAVRVGGAPTALDRHAPGWARRARLVVAPWPYEHPVPGRLGRLLLDPHYEAKCLRWLRPGDLLWTVGIRSSVLSRFRAGARTPRR